MTVDRKKFLEILVTGGLGALFGGSVLIPGRWKEKGISLTKVQRQSLVMGSVISFQVIAENESDGYEAIRRAEQVFRSLERKFSMYDEESEMAKLAGQAGKQPVEVSPEALELLRFAKEVYRRSNGRFDVTVEPAMKRWGFRDNPGQSVAPPTDKELRRLERLISSDKIAIEGEKVLLTEPGMAIDTGGIAGGYALDQAISEMKKSDVSAAFINFSGDIHCFGRPVDGQKWPVHILNPRTGQPLQDPVKLSDEALSTSGSYQNRRHDSSSQSWGHLLLPKQAEPTEPVGSVTAIHTSALMADTWSTAAYVGASPPSEVRSIVIESS